MIRKYTPPDTDAIITLWLEASAISHGFAGRAYWEAMTEEVRNTYLPRSVTHVYETEGEILGFISMLEDNVAGLFVSPSAQGRGIGSKLIDFVKACHPKLTLSVFKDNPRARKFYEREGFHPTGEGIDSATGFPEIYMAWEK